MQQIFAEAGQPAKEYSLWGGAGGPEEVFLAAATNRPVIGTRAIEPGTQYPAGSIFVSRVTAQLTDDGHLTSAGGKYCAQYGIESNIDALKRHAALYAPKRTR